MFAKAREGQCVTCETSLTNGDVGFHASMIHKLKICFPSHGSLVTSRSLPCPSGVVSLRLGLLPSAGKSKSAA